MTLMKLPINPLEGISTGDLLRELARREEGTSNIRESGQCCGTCDYYGPGSGTFGDCMAQTTTTMMVRTSFDNWCPHWGRKEG